MKDQQGDALLINPYRSMPYSAAVYIYIALLSFGFALVAVDACNWNYKQCNGYHLTFEVTLSLLIAHKSSTK